jgi:hypothetical protein
MKGEENLINSIDEAWIGRIKSKTKKEEKEVLATLSDHASRNFYTFSNPVGYVEYELKDRITLFSEKNNWDYREVRRAYRLAHGKITTLGLRGGHLT